jgi:hypothetical protein
MSKITLRRYTDLACTINILRNKAITLLDPKNWDDQNDAYFLNRYKVRKPAKSVLAYCFAKAPETYHHWKVYAPGPHGVCIEFDEDRLLASLPGGAGIKSGAVEYKQIKDVRRVHPKLEELPFLKRYPYRGEEEFRLIYVDTTEVLSAKDFTISIESIQRITLSPWLNPALLEAVKATLVEIPGCSTLDISRSQLVGWKKWQKVADAPE